MSSHHIVRDEQEPALIISDFLPTQSEDIGQLLEWSPTVVGLEYALQDLLTMGIKIDVAVMPEKNVTYWEKELSYQQPIRFFTSSGSPFEQFVQIIRQLQKEKYKTFHILSNQLNLFDFINLFENFRETAEVIYFSETQKISISPIGNYKKWLRKNHEVAVMPIDEPTYIRTSGFTDNANNELLPSERHFITKNEGLVTIETNLKPLIISEQL
ncbi:MAG: hypothetical protein WBA74_24830 [Cyclobacteriaceae bacterium]